ncbi:MAG TPA: hypothetical protein PK358_05405 [Spirochaetota bacterium]|nr:hypothetical protein [Spirochaetota bacterium]HPJ34252.1 hypothetical protein [Spirochaetota bacterium]
MAKVLISFFILLPLAVVNAEAADYSGIWLVKKDCYQIVVTGSGDNYNFKKISFYRGKRHEHTGKFTVSGNYLRIQYSVGQKATARIKSSTHFVESSTVNWEKISNSTRYPVFNITGTWEYFNAKYVIKQTGSKVTGVKYFNGKEYSKLTGEIEGYLLRLKEEFVSSIKPMETSFMVLDNNTITVSSWGGQSKSWKKTGSSAVVPDTKREDKEDKSAKIKIAGNWVIEGISSSVKITETAAGIFFNTTFTMNGKDVKWVGSGKLNGNDLNIRYRYVKNKPKGFENGTMDLRVVNKSRIEGKWVSDSKKYSEKIVFKRK